MKLHDWAIRWNVPKEAIAELRALLGVIYTKQVLNVSKSEASVLNDVRLEAAQKGCHLWRNNNGALYSKDGQFVRFGLANDSEKINKVIKSADLIGIKPILITEAHIGKTIGQFVSRETKKPDWKYTGTERERAQLHWAELITSFGGDACFTTGVGTI
jgi:hypothetical protein